jgi:hypothetical protein
VTDEQRSRRPIFIATLWAEVSWLFFRVARSTHMTQIWALRSRLEKQPTGLRQNTSYYGDRTLERQPKTKTLHDAANDGVDRSSEEFISHPANHGVHIPCPGNGDELPIKVFPTTRRQVNNNHSLLQ